MSNTGWGKAKYGSGEFQRTGKPAKGPGNNYIRILPPMHSLAEEGIWAVYRTTHWGYAGVSPKDANKTVVRPFLCIEDKDRRTQMVKQACPECDLYNKKDDECKAEAAALKATGKTDDQIKKELEEQLKWLQAHAPERKWYLNVKYKDGKFGDYKINHKTHKKGIDNKIQELLKEQEIDALDPEQGVWFNIKRTGNGWDTPDTIEVEMEAIEPGKPSKGFRTLLAPLSAEDFETANKSCRDLKDAGGQVLTFAQIRELTLSGNDPDTVDEIMGARNKGDSGRAAPPASEEDEDEAPPAETTKEAMTKAVDDVGKALGKLADAVKTEVKGDSAKAELDPELQARRDAILAKRKAAAEAEAKAKAEEAAKAAPKSTPRELSDDEVLAIFDNA
jgi:hypothetical protein